MTIHPSTVLTDTANATRLTDHCEKTWHPPQNRSMVAKPWPQTTCTELAATLRWFTAGVQSASLYDNFRKRGNYVIMTS